MEARFYASARIEEVAVHTIDPPQEVRDEIQRLEEFAGSSVMSRIRPRDEHGNDIDIVQRGLIWSGDGRALLWALVAVLKQYDRQHTRIRWEYTNEVMTRTYSIGCLVQITAGSDWAVSNAETGMTTREFRSNRIGAVTAPDQRPAVIPKSGDAQKRRLTLRRK